MRILVVEDNKKLARFLQKALAEEGYATDVVGNGRAAVERAKAEEYDLILLDWMLPELDGLGVCRALREGHVRTRILMLTARAEVTERIAGLDSGADDYLTKPFDLGELLARCRALTRRGAPTGEGPWKLGPLVVDRGERKVTLEGRRIDLTPKEFALLVHLAREVGRVVARADLLARTWDTALDPGSNVIEVHIKNIRDKLGEHARMIETVRGIGYRLVVPQ
jgi:DNA-binding response OmpR family regulator